MSYMYKSNHLMKILKSKHYGLRNCHDFSVVWMKFYLVFLCGWATYYFTKNIKLFWMPSWKVVPNLTKIWEKLGRLTLILGIMTLIFRENIHINGLNKCLKEFASALIVGKGLSSKSSSLEHAFFMKKQGLHANIMFVKSYILTNIDIYWSPACV